MLAVVIYEYICQWSGTVKYERKTYETKLIQIISLSILLLLPLSGNGAELGTRQRAITPVAVAQYTPFIYPADVAAHPPWNVERGTRNNVANISPYSVSATNTAKFYRAAE
jgi:hypothetical protein